MPCFWSRTSPCCGGRRWRLWWTPSGRGLTPWRPCLFPARFFPELRSLTEDQGGSTVIRRHQEELVLVEVPACQLEDVDEPQALLALAQGETLV